MPRFFLHQVLSRILSCKRLAVQGAVVQLCGLTPFFIRMRSGDGLFINLGCLCMIGFHCVRGAQSSIRGSFTRRMVLCCRSLWIAKLQCQTRRQLSSLVTTRFLLLLLHARTSLELRSVRPAFVRLGLPCDSVFLPFGAIQKMGVRYCTYVQVNFYKAVDALHLIQPTQLLNDMMCASMALQTVTLASYSAHCHRCKQQCYLARHQCW